ncbi:hypothetical protein, partial [Novosphingobium sp. UBA1939]|uniref:hypothetical protein n=1 Tax=Novosphingobium sp. UBA1939 TaxID=1946982 RepID=UPI0025E96EE2
MPLDRTETAIALIKGQEDGGQSDGPISSFLAQYVSVVLYAEMEEEIASVVRDHITSCSSAALGLFIQGNMDGIIRRTPKSDIGKLVLQFGEAFKTAFEDKIDPSSVSRYSNVIAARHAVGHRQGSSITLAEVELGLAGANLIISALKECGGFEKLWR